MASYGGSAAAGAGATTTTLDTANINVTGSDLCLICGSADEEGTELTHTIVWDPSGNNESMTGNFADIEAGTFMDSRLDYLDDPTAANAPVRVTISASRNEFTVFGAFFTAAGNIVSGDTANDSFAGTGTSLSATVPNVASGDMVVDWLAIGEQTALTVGANQTSRHTNVDSGSFLRCAVSTQAGADGGVMSWTFGSVDFGAILIAARVPDVGGAAANPKGPLGMPLHGPFAGPV